MVDDPHNLSLAMLGESFSAGARHQAVVRADDLLPWYEPAPAVVQLMRQHQNWLLSAAQGERGPELEQALAKHHKLMSNQVFVAPSPASLQQTVLSQMVEAQQTVLLVDADAELVDWCQARLPGHLLQISVQGTDDAVEVLAAQLHQTRVDWVILGNPLPSNGHLFSVDELRCLMAMAGGETRFWIDERYMDFRGEQSADRLLDARGRMFVARSLHASHALGGVGVAYLLAHAEVIDELRRFQPLGLISLPAQVASLAALHCEAYYRQRWNETRFLRQLLAAGLHDLPGISVVDPGLHYLFVDGDPQLLRAIWQACAEEGIFIACLESSELRLRISVRDPDDNERIRAVCAQLCGAGQSGRTLAG